MPEALSVATALAMIAGWAFSVSVQLLGRSFRHQPAELLAERLVDLVEDVAGGPAGFGQRLAHAHRLAPLPREDECAHRSCLLFRGGW